MIAKHPENYFKLFLIMRKLLILLIVTGFGFYFWFIMRSYNIVSIECISQFTKCNSDILYSIDKIEKDGIFTTRNNIKNVLNGNPLIKKYSFQLKLNGKYVLHIEERIPKYCIKSSENTYLTDPEGLIIKIGDSGGIKCISESNSDYKSGDKLTKKDLFLQKVLYDIRNINGIGDAYISDNNLIVEYKGKIKLIFPSEGDPRSLAGKVYFTVSQFDKIEKYIIENGNVSVSEVDFRFNDPIVRFI